MITPTPPVFANEHGDLNVFSSLADMSGYVEVLDVENHEYEFFDATARRLSACVGANTVTFAVNENESPDPDVLEALLRRLFEHLSRRYESFAQRAEQAKRLDELVVLSQELLNSRPRGLLSRLFNRSQ